MPYRGVTYAFIAFGMWVLSCFCADVAQAATVRPSVKISGDVVSLSDLFDGLEPGQDRVLGPAPAPGKTIQIGGYQLIAIADQYGVEWEDQSSSVNVLVTRAGRVLGRDYFAHLVKRSIALNENAGGFVVNISNFHSVTVAFDDKDPVTLSEISWDKRSGRFTTTAYLSHQTGDPLVDSFPVRGTIRITQSVVVYNDSLPAGHIMQDSDMHLDPSYSGELPASPQALPDPNTIVGMALSHAVAAGQAVKTMDLRRAILVHQGDPVLITYTVPGIRLTATGRALEEGGSGQYVHALNLGSQMVVSGKVNAAGEVNVDATSTALPANSPEVKRFGMAIMTTNGGRRE
ncbi:flagellar basal body P-ring formation chaperone FlgA [Saccharibacter floricola]|uniref:Flagellar basal body P-ring biosynthesis protein FlgA n=1 Tax=Saccharibacter floricola DSM 15669 TaxID=1123227 RepID=A0ABQ0NXV8_9PROT|nr:flagellar basal body P-ring formation chaperone FlgA [Saccharibacter floricola]GBQ05884.1 flagellar basal body P-ring biosynthesis protein FlgA [Saccharibacter floricola DSM 15669]